MKYLSAKVFHRLKAPVCERNKGKPAEGRFTLFNRYLKTCIEVFRRRSLLQLIIDMMFELGMLVDLCED
jgi:hypothetical protein